jgi:hypothetical protein
MMHGFRQMSPADVYLRGDSLTRLEVRQAVAATEVVPRPKAISAAVSNDVTSRSLVVRCPDTESGYGRLLWREAFAALKKDDERGRTDLYASRFYEDRLAYAVPGDLQTLRFHFPLDGSTAYTELTAKPGLRAIVTIDISTRRFLTCRFIIRP